MNDRFIRLTNDNTTELYDLGYLNIGNLAKYRWLETNMLSYGLDDKDNNWHTGIVSHTYKVGFVRNSYEVIVDNTGISDKIEYLYDIIVYTFDPSLPRETISIDTHEIYLAKV